MKATFLFARANYTTFAVSTASAQKPRLYHMADGRPGARGENYLALLGASQFYVEQRSSTKRDSVLLHSNSYVSNAVYVMP